MEKSSLPGKAKHAFSQAKKLFRQTVESARRKPQALIAAAVIVGVFATFATFALPAAVWVAQPSTNCPAQAAGNVMVTVGNYVYVLGTSTGQSFWKFEPATGICNATPLADPPNASLPTSGASMEKIDNDTIYVHLGGSTRDLYMYKITQNQWYTGPNTRSGDLSTSDLIPMSSTAQTAGTKVLGLNNEVYYFSGANLFRKYRPSTNDWVDLTTLSITDGAAFTSVGNRIYAFISGTAVRSFDTQQTLPGTWTIEDSTPTAFSGGSSLAAVNDQIYAFFGNNTKNFYRYDTTAASGSRWKTTKTDNITPLTSPPDFIFGGGSLVYPGTGNYLYALQGNNQKNFWRYDLVNNTWTSMASAPGKVGPGGSLTSDGTNIYATQGNASHEIWRYNIANNRWNNTADGALLESTFVDIGTSFTTDMVNNPPKGSGGITYISVGNSGGGELFVTSGNKTSTIMSGDIFRMPLTGVNANKFPLWNIARSPTTLGEGTTISYPGASAQDLNGDYMYLLDGVSTANFNKFLLPYNTYIPWPRSKITIDGDPNVPLSQNLPLLTSAVAQSTGTTMLEVDGKFYYLFGSSNRFYSFDPARNEWKKLTDTPQTIGSGAAMVKIDNNTIYVLGGINSTWLGEQRGDLWKYDIANDTWIAYSIGKLDDNTTIDQNFGTSYQSYGSSIEVVNGKFYAMLGSTGGLYRYDPASNSWLLLMNSNNLITGRGASMETVGTDIYIMPTQFGNTGLIRYNTLTNTWTSLAGMGAGSPAEDYSGAGTTIIYPGSGNFLYGFKGYYTGGNRANRQFWRYSISGNTWVAMANTPQDIDGGAGLTVLPSDQNNLYAIAGGRSKEIWRYNIPSNIWYSTQTSGTVFAKVPGEVMSGGDLETDGTYLYVTQGGESFTFWRYNFGTNTWTTLANTPAEVGIACSLNVGGNCTSDGGDMVFYDPTPGSPNSGDEDIWLVSGSGSFGPRTDGGCSIGSSKSCGILYRYKIATNEWPVTQKPDPAPNSISNGASLSYPGTGNFIYAFKGNNGRDFWSYDMVNNRWRSMYEPVLDDGNEIATPGEIPIPLGSSSANVNQGLGNDMVEVNGKIYVYMGDSTVSSADNVFMSYDPIANTWTQLPDSPFAASFNSAFAIQKYDNNTIYVRQHGTSGMSMAKYIIDADPSKSGDQGVWSLFNMGTRDDGVPLNQGDNLRTRFIVQSGGKFYVLSDDATTPFRSYDPVTNEWTSLEWEPMTISSSADMVAVGSDEIYVILGSNAFYKYTISQNHWTILAINSGSCSSGIGAGSSLVYHPSGNYIYRIKGGTTNVFCRFNVGTQTWDTTALATTPATVSGGGSSAIIGNNIYVFGGNGTTNFWRYNITNNRWNNTLDGEDPTNGGNTTLNDQAPSPIFSGASLTTDGTYLYAVKGSKSTTFWRYNPAGTTGNRWTAMSAAPVKFGQYQANTFNDGGDLTFYDPTPGSPGSGDEDIWAVSASSLDGYGGGGSNTDMTIGGALFRYKISTNTWPYLPGPQIADNSGISSNGLAHSGGGIYTADDTTDTLTDTSHGLGNNSKLTLTTTGTFPGGLNAGPYYVVNATTDTFQLATQPGGSAIDITTTGSGTQSYAASYIYGFVTNTQFGRYDVTTNEWTYYNRPKYTGSTGVDMIQEYGLAQGIGASVVSLNNIIYSFPGNFSERFFSYTPATNRWTELDNLPSSSAATFGTGAAMTTVGTDFIYAINNTDSTFYKYTVSKNAWSIRANPPAGTNHGAAMAYPGSGDFIYLLRGNSTTTMYRYCFQNTGSGCTVNTWATAAGTTPATISSGGSLVGVGGALYATHGGNTVDFYKYTITNSPSVGDGTWSTLANMRVSGTYTPDQTTDILTATSHGLTNATKLTLSTTGTFPSGLGAGPYFVINATTDTFQLSSTQGGTAINFTTNGTGVQSYNTNYTEGAGTSLTTDGTNIFATAGNGNTGIMKYTVLSNAWSMMPTLPTTAAVGDGSGNTKGGITYIASGPSGGAELYVTTGNDNYQAGTNTTAMLYAMPFTGADANTWPMVAGPADMPASISTGAALVHPTVGQRIYALQGGSVNFWSYDTATNAWNSFDPPNIPTATGGGASMVTNGIDSIFTTRGGANSEVYRYCFATGPNCASAHMWLSLTNFRTTIGGGNDKGGLAYLSTGPSGGPELYLVTGDGQSYTVQSNSTTVPGRKLLFRYPFTGPNANTWPVSNRTPLPQPDATIYSGGSLVYSNGAFDGANGSFYALLGNATNAFRKYTITNSPNPGDGTWSAPTTTGFTGGVSLGGSLISDGSGTTLYSVNGNSTTTVQKYTITSSTTGTWSALAAAPVTIGVSGGGETVYYNNKLWMSSGKGVSEMEDSYGNGYNALMYIYDITGNTWPAYTPAADLPANTNTFNRGSDLAATPDGLTIYALRGTAGTAPTIANPNFWKYTVSGSGLGTWTPLTNMPTNTGLFPTESGGALAAINNNIIYATRGGLTTDFYKYDSTAASGSEWSAQSSLPTGIGASSFGETGDIVWNPTTGNIYMTPGNDTTTAPYTIYSFPINRLTITSVTKTGGGTPIAGQSMDVTVQAVDYNNAPINVGNNVQVTISLNTGTGSLGGTLIGTISSGTNSTVISGTTYNQPEGGVILSATDTTTPANPTIYASSNSDPFTINGATPTISGLNTTTGPTAGATAVTITGSDFYTNYKRPITVSNSNSSALTNYPVQFTVDTATLIASGKMRSDCGDIRFTAAGAGSTDYGLLPQLPYWLESGCNSSNTVVWVKIPSISANSTYSVDMFYGDGRLTSTSSGDNTFAFFDDFTGATLNTSKWTEVDSGSYVTVNNKLYLSGGPNQGIYSVTDGTEGNSDGDSNFNRANNNMLEFDFRTNSGSSSLMMGWKDTTNTLGGYFTAVNSGGFIHGINYNGTSNDDVYENAASTNSTNSQKWFANRDYKVRVNMRDATGGNGAIYQRSWDNGKTWVNWLTNTTRSDASAKIAFSTYYIAGEIDNVKVYPYVSSALTTTLGTEAPNLSVTFDGNPAIYVSSTTSQVKVITPSHASGPANVILSNGDGQSTISYGAFTYQLPTISAITPDTGDPTGGTPIVIDGTNFAPDHYRKAITIDNSSGGALSDYQLQLTIDTASLIAAGKMHPNGNDIRFYDTDGTTQITNYWIEGPMNSATSKIWVKVPSIPAATTKVIYIEYGNIALSPLSSVSNTFVREIDSLSLAASYPMDETSGNVSDFSGNGNTGVNTNSTTIAGKFNNARSFNGSNTYINAGNNTASQLLGGMSIEAWVNLSSTTNNVAPRIVSKSDDANSPPANWMNGYALSIGQPNDTSTTICGRSGNLANKVIFALGDGNYSTAYCVAPTTALSPVTGSWHHIVATFDPATITGRVYVDGVQTGINTTLTTEAAATTTQNLTFGRPSSAASQYLNGSIDDVRLYSKTLSAAEVTDLYGTSPNNNQGYTTTLYPGRVLVRKFQSPQPSVTFGDEAGNIDVTFDGTPATVTNASITSISLTNPAHAVGVVPVVVTNAVDGQTVSTSYEYAILTPDKTETTVTASPNSGLEADGVDSSTVTVTLLTDGSDPVPNHVVTLAQLTGTASGTIITAIDCPNPEPAGNAPGTSNVNGKACFTVKTQTPGASEYDGAYTYEASDATNPIIFDDAADHPSITFVTEVTHKGNTTVTAPGGNVTADGVSTKTITATLKNRNNVIIPNRTVRLNQISGPGTATIVPSSGDTDASGVRTFTVSTTTAGTYIFQAEDIETVPNVLFDDVVDTITVVFVPGATDPGITHSTLSVDPTTLPANGTNATLTATIKDQFDNVISEKTVSMSRFSGPTAETITPIDCPSPEPAGSAPGVSNVNGKACATISAIQSGAYIIQATETTSNPDVILDQVATINFTAPTAADSTLVAVPTSTVANGMDYSLVTATIKDGDNNLFPNHSVTLSQISGTGSPVIDAVDCDDLTSLSTGATSTTNSSANACYLVTSLNLGTFGFKATDDTESLDIAQTINIIFGEGPTWQTNGKQLAFSVEDDSIYQQRFQPKVIKTSDGNFVGISDVSLYPSSRGAIYVQKFDANGNSMWPGAAPDNIGIHLDTDTVGGELTNGEYELLADNNGGVFIIWEKSSVLYGVRFDSNGNNLWSSTPKTLVSNAQPANINDCGGSQTPGVCNTIPLISDGTGGFFIAYRDFNVTVGGRVRVSRFDSNGDMVTGEGWPQPVVGGADQTSASVCVTGPINLSLIRPGAVRVAYIRQVPDHSNNINCSAFVNDRYGEYFRSINTSNPADLITDGAINTRSSYTIDPDLTTVYGSCFFTTPGNVDYIKQFEVSGGVYTISINNCPYLNTQNGRLIVHYQNKDGVLWNYELSPGGTFSYATNFDAIPDGSGGIIILYNTEENNNNLFLTRIRNSATNTPEEPWNGGTRITVANNNPNYFHIVPGDTVNSAIVVYSQYLSGDHFIVKKYDGNGNLVGGWPTTGVDIGTGFYSETYSIASESQGKSIVADGSGGVVITGEDYINGWRNVNSYQQYPNVIQRVSNSGSILWNGGQSTDMNPGLDTIDRPLKEQKEQKIVHIGNGEYVMAWQEEAKSWFDQHTNSTHNIHIDKFDSNGDHLWQVPQANEREGAGIRAGYDSVPGGGAVIDNDSIKLTADQIISDPNGNTLIAWRSITNSASFIMAAKFDIDGGMTWGPIALTSSGTSSQPDILTDGNSGTYVTWIQNNDVYAAKINSAGGVSWNTQITNTVGITESNPRLVRYGTTTLYVVYEQNNVGTAIDIVAQRRNPTNGAIAAGPTFIDGNIGNQEIGDVIPYGTTSGFIIAYTDDQAGPNNKQIKADRINSSLSSTVFPSIVSDTTVNNLNPRLASDDAGGAYIVWERYNAAGTTSNIAFTSLHNNNGGLYWDVLTLGDPNVNVLRQNPTIVPDGNDQDYDHAGFFISWQQDDESNATKHIYTSHVVNGIPQEGDLAGTSIGNINTRTDVIPTIATDLENNAVTAWTGSSSPSDVWGQRTYEADSSYNSTFTSSGSVVAGPGIAYLTATLLDQNDAPVEGHTFRIDVIKHNYGPPYNQEPVITPYTDSTHCPGGTAGVTNADGQACFTITSQYPGRDSHLAATDITDPNNLLTLSPTYFQYFSYATPQLDLLTPNSGSENGGTTVDVTGSGLYPDTVFFIDGSPVSSTYIDYNHAQIITGVHAPGAADVMALNNNEIASNTLPFTFLQSVHVYDINPAEGTQNTVVPVTITGINIDPGATAKITLTGDPDVDCTGVVVSLDGTSLTCTLDLTGVTNDLWDVVVTNPGGFSDTLVDGFQVELPADANTSTVTANPLSVPADGTTPSIITVTMRDSLNNPSDYDNVRVTSIAGDGTPVIIAVDCVDYLSLTNIPPNESTTDKFGEACFSVTNTVRGTNTFQAEDLTAGITVTQTANVNFSCVVGPNEQCAELVINGANGSLTVTAPDNFAFPAASANGQSFSQNDPGYVLNTNDVVTVSDTRNAGGFNLQVQADAAGFNDGSGHFLPLQDLYVATKAATTTGTASNGVEYNGLLTSPQNIVAFQDTTGLLTDALSFTSCGSGLGTGGTLLSAGTPSPVDLMLGGLSSGGRNGDFKQNVNYYLDIPPGTYSGSYSVTLTYTVTDDSTDPPATPPSCP